MTIEGFDTPAMMTGTFYGLEFLKIRVSAPVFTKRFPWLSEQSIWRANVAHRRRCSLRRMICLSICDLDIMKTL
jgi:hypothetical protein